MEIGFAVCGSFCTYSIVFPVMEQLSREHHVTPIFSDAAYSVDSRFGTAREHTVMAETICGTPPLHTLAQVEPVGPKKLFDILIIAPCTGNTLAKLAAGIVDTPVCMAVKSHLRSQRPVVIAVSTNDALAGASKNIGILRNYKHFYFVPVFQDDPVNKPFSMISDFSRIPQTIEAALDGIQIQPMLTTMESQN